MKNSAHLGQIVLAIGTVMTVSACTSSNTYPSGTSSSSSPQTQTSSAQAPQAPAAFLPDGTGSALAVSTAPAQTHAPSSEAATWKTYTNSDDGFEFHYPASWKAPIIATNMPRLDLPFTISIFPNPKNLSSKDFASYALGVNDVGLDMKYVTQKELTIGGFPAYELYGFPETVGSVVIFLAKGSNVFILGFAKANPDVANEVNNNKVVHQILSTFTFIK